MNMDPTPSQSIDLKAERVTKGNMVTEKNPINHEIGGGGKQISNEECFVNINRPLDNVMSSLKYLPFDKHFDNLPTEMKTNILGYCDMCDNKAFVAASVCQDWRDILRGRVQSLEEVNIGEYCSNCCDKVCSDPKEMLKASTVHKLDIPLSISHPVTEVDPNLLTQALTGVSKISISAEEYYLKSVMTPQQMQHLFVGLQNKKEIMDSVTFTDVKLAHLDQDELVNYFLKKTKKLALDCGFEDDDMVDSEKLIRKLNNSMDIKLEHLSLGHLAFQDEISVDLADGLCKIKIVDIKKHFQLNNTIIDRLLENILTRSITMKSLHIEAFVDWKSIDTDDFKKLFENLEFVTLHGKFTLEQQDVVIWNIPGNGIEVIRSFPDFPDFEDFEDDWVITKGSI